MTSERVDLQVADDTFTAKRSDKKGVMNLRFPFIGSSLTGQGDVLLLENTSARVNFSSYRTFTAH